MAKQAEQKLVYPNKDYYKNRPLAVRIGAKFFPYHDKFGADLAEFFLPSFLSVDQKNIRDDVDYIRHRMQIGEAMEVFGFLLFAEVPFFGAFSYLMGRTFTQWAEESSLDLTFKKERTNDERIRSEAGQNKKQIQIKDFAEALIGFFSTDTKEIPYKAIDFMRFSYMLETYGEDKELNAINIKLKNTDYFSLDDDLRRMWGQKFETFFQMSFEKTRGTSEKEADDYLTKSLVSFSKYAKVNPKDEKPQTFVILNKNEDLYAKIIEQTGLFEKTKNVTDDRMLYVLNWSKLLEVK